MANVFESRRALYRDEKDCDLTVSCGGRQFKLHRAIICSQSPFFDKALSIGFSETFTGQIDLPEDDPNIFDKFIQFIYTGNYEDEEHLSPSDPAEPATLSLEEVQERLATATVTAGDTSMDGDGSDDDADYDDAEEIESDIDEEENEVYNIGQQVGPLIFWEMDEYITETPHAMFTSLRVYVMADKFCVPSLKLLARDRFYRSVERHVMSDDFPAVIDEVYETTPPWDLGLKAICCRIITPVYTVYNYGWYNDFRIKMQPVMRKHGELAMDVLHYTIIQASYKCCSRCGRDSNHEDVTSLWLREMRWLDP